MFQEIERFSLPIMKEALNSLFYIYCFQYNSSCQDKKKYLCLQFLIERMTRPEDFNLK
jgi:hypothetical protein